MIKSILGDLNVTLTDVEHNDKLVKKGLMEIQTSLSSETAGKLTMFGKIYDRETYLTSEQCPYTSTKKHRSVAG